MPHPPYVHPVAWTIQLYDAKGDIISEIIKSPQAPLIIMGDATIMSLRAPEICHAMRFFTPASPYQHGLN